MKIHHNVISSLPRLYTQNQDNNQMNNQLKMETGPALPGHDSVEISEAAKRLAEGISDRQLPVDAMEHDWIRPFFTDEIDTSLQQLLGGKSPKVEAAVNFLISSNFVTDGSVPDENERAALLESGLSQAQYISDNYMTDEEADEFLATMNMIAAYAKTRTVDPETGQASYIEIPRKPKGAPDDYVDIDYLMKKHDPESAHKITDILKDTLNGGSITGFNEILKGFIQKLAQNPQWPSDYHTEINDLNMALKNANINNRFKGADTSNMAAFLQDMEDKFQRHTSFANNDFLLENIRYFAFLLGERI